MQQELNGQYCEICNRNPAMAEQLYGVWTCGSCAKENGMERENERKQHADTVRHN